MKSPAQFNEYFARVVVVESAEGQAVVNQQVAIGDVERGDGGGEPFAEGFAER